MFRISLFLLLFRTMLFAAERADIIVAKDGSGQFTSIQAAINSIPQNNSQQVVIFIKRGTYNEKLFISTNNISLVGEDRDSTRIVFAELRKNWLKDHSIDWGAATINIDSGIAHITLANLTIHNNYGSLFGDHDHQFAIWAKGTKIAIVYCNIIADGGDTVSLWNSTDGMYYLSHCYFEGWVDYVCPRGWCYITDSRFYGHNKTASLWHHGANDEDQKFVIRYSYFDGVKDFPLGRHHVDGQFYFLDCMFSRNLADEQIHYPSYSPNARIWKWGERHYYFNCHREGGDYAWFADNLATAKNSPDPYSITAKWTFNGRWDPETTLSNILPFIAFPTPRSGSYDIAAANVMLRWLPSLKAKKSIVYFGKGKNPPLHSVRMKSMVQMGRLEPATRYFWRVDEITGADTLTGPLWHFTTQ